MQRTRPDDVLRLSGEELEGDGEEGMATARSSLGPSSSRAASAGLSSAYLNTPRGQLLRSLAAEAGAAQAERRASRLAPAPRSYEEVLAEVEAALRRGQADSGSTATAVSAGSSRIPHPIQQQAAVPVATKRQAYLSPSRIPKLGLAVSLPPADENACASALSSPDKTVAANGSRELSSHPLRVSQDNMQLR